MTSASKDVNIAFLDIGHGDCTVVYDSNRSSALVIDCGHGPTLLAFLSTEGIGHIDVALVTHNDGDHVRGMLQVVQARKVDFLAIPPGISDAGGEPRRILRKLLDEVGKQNLAFDWVSTQNRGLLDRLGQLSYQAELLYPTPFQGTQASRPNATSGVLRVEASGAAALITGDLDTEGWRRLLQYPAMRAKVRADILKFPHHGGSLVDAADRPEAEEYTKLLLQSVRPGTTVISTAQRQGWQHPDPGVIKALRTYGSGRSHRLLCTQVTTLCEPDFLKKRRAALAILPALHHSPCNTTGKGCPCAGTVRVRFTHSGAVDVLPGTEHERVVQLFSRHQCDLP